MSEETKGIAGMSVLEIIEARARVSKALAKMPEIPVEKRDFYVGTILTELAFGQPAMVVRFKD